MITEDDFRFFSNQHGAYWLRVDTAGRAYVQFDDHAGGVHFELDAFMTQSNLREAKNALAVLIGDLIKHAQAQAQAA